MFKPILSDSVPLRQEPPRWQRWYPLARRAGIVLIAAAVVFNLILLGAVGLEYAGGWRMRGSDFTQHMSVSIERIDPKRQTIRVAGDLVGIMGADVVVTAETWIGIDRQLAAFGELRDGLRANIAFVLEGEQRIARWIAASSSRAPQPLPTESGSASFGAPPR